MTVSDSHSAPRHFYLRSAGAGLVLTLGLVGTAGCHQRASPKVVATAPAARTSEALESVREAFKKQAGPAAFRGALQQWNSNLGGASDQKPASLTDAQRQLLARDVGLDDDELTEVASATFTPLDAHYLDQCLLLRDAVRSFDFPELDPLRRATNAFAWVVRQVQLQEQDAEPLPPAFVLRRGWGTSLERSYLYLAVLHQMGLDGCLTVYPVEASGQGIARFWIPGVLVGKDIYLFDTRLGMPLPGPAGQGIATLAQARSQKDLFDQLAIDPKDARHRYDLTPEQAARAEVLLTWPLSALAPRMTNLENLLASMSNKVRLSADPAAQRQAFTAAVGDSKIPVRLDNRLSAYTYATPLRVLRHFLPPAEGGVDPSSPPRTRQALAERQLILWRPDEQPTRSPGEAMVLRALGHAFSELFAQFPLPPPRNLQIQDKNTAVGIGREPGTTQGDTKLRFEQYLIVPVVQYLAGGGNANPRDLVSQHFALRPKSPRDDVLRGRWDEATTKLVEVQDQVRLQKSLAQTAPAGEPMKQWVPDAVAAQNEFLDAVRTGDAARVAAAQQRLILMWRGSVQAAAPEGNEAEKAPDAQKARSRMPAWLPFVLGLAAPPMGAEATYLLALSKQEKAERAQARLDAGTGAKAAAQTKECHDAWESAAHWWKTYLDDYPSGPAVAAARLGYARALAALGQPEPARALLRDLGGKLSPLEETARLYRAQHLK